MAENIKIDLLINAAQSAKTIGETKKALRDLKSEALNLKEGTAAFTKVATAAGELQDKIKDLSATTAYLGDDLRKIKGIAGIGEGIAGGFAMAQGAAAIFGGENKKLEESMVKLQAVMAVIQGMTAIGNVLQKESAAVLFIKNTVTKAAIALGWQDVASKEAQTVATVAETAATEGQIVATESATISQKLLNLAMKANPIALLVTLIVAGVSALMLWSNASSKAAAEEKKANEEKKKSAELLKKQREEQQKDTAEVAKSAGSYITMIEKLRQTNAGSKERRDLIKEINSTYGATLKNISDEKAFQDQLNSSVDQYIKFKEQEYIIKKNAEKIDIATQGKLDAQAEINKAQKEFIELEKEANKQGSSYKGIMPAELQDRIDKATAKIAKMSEWQQALGLSTENTSKSMEKLGFKTEEAMKAGIKSADDAINKQKELTAASLKARQDLLNARVKLSEEEKAELDKIEQQIIDNMSEGYDKDIAAAEKNYEDKKSIFNKSGDDRIKDLEDAQKVAIEKAKLAGESIDVKKIAEDAAQIKSIRDAQVKYEIQLSEERANAYNEAFIKDENATTELKKKMTLKAIEDIDKMEKDALNKRFSDETTRGEEYLKELDAINKRKENLLKVHDAAILDMETQSIEDREYIAFASSASREIVLNDEAKKELKILEDAYNSKLKSEEDYQLEKQALMDKYTVETKSTTISLGDTTIEYDSTKTYLQNVVLLYEKKYGKITEIVTDANKDRAEEQKNADKEELVRKQKMLDEMVKLEQLAQQQIMQVINDAAAKREYNINKEYDTKIAKIDEEQLAYQNAQANRTMDQQIQYDIEQGFENQKLEAEKVRNIEIDKVKKRQFDAQKINDMASVAINTAVGISKTVAEVGYPLAIPFVILSVAQGLVQEGIIASKKYIPSFATGGLFQGDGMVSGPGTGTSDSVNAKLSTGESVINAKSTKLFGPVLSAINQAGGGKAIPHLKNGGIYTEPVQQSSGVLDTQAIVNAIYATNDRPIETYVKESSITTAQKNKQKLKNRTSF